MAGKREKDIRQTATEIVRRLQRAGFSAFWVGGCVRDLLLGKQPADYDIATSARPEEIERIFPHTTPVGRKFGVVIVLEGEHQYQVATFRAEGDYRDGRRPERVVFGDAKADAERRDFTINGLFMDPLREELHDWVGGRADLEAHVVRTIGNPEERFQEDHLRLLRAVRFAAQLGFEIEENTFRAIQRNVERIKAISAERIRDELNKLFAPPHAPRGLRLLQKSGLLEQILPEIAATVHCEQSPDYHPEGSVFNHLVLMLKYLPADADPALPWAVLLHDVAKPVTARRQADGGIHFYGHERIGAAIARQILGRLRFPRKEIEDIAKAVRCHMQFKDAMQMRKSTLRRLLMRPTFPLELELHRLDCLGSHGQLDVYEFLRNQAEELSHQPEIRPPLIKGNDLKTLGMHSGPAMGKLLAEIREKQLQDELKTAAEARAWARQRIPQLKHEKIEQRTRRDPEDDTIEP